MHANKLPNVCAYIIFVSPRKLTNDVSTFAEEFPNANKVRPVIISFSSNLFEIIESAGRKLVPSNDDFHVRKKVLSAEKFTCINYNLSVVFSRMAKREAQMTTYNVKHFFSHEWFHMCILFSRDTYHYKNTRVKFKDMVRHGAAVNEMCVIDELVISMTICRMRNDIANSCFRQSVDNFTILLWKENHNTE